MPDPTYIDFLETYAAGVEKIYSIVRLELYPDNGTECLYKSVIQPTLQQAVSERFGFLMVTGETIKIFDKYIALLDSEKEPRHYEFPQLSAVATMKKTIEMIKQQITEPDYIAHLNDAATQDLGLHSQTALYLGVDTATEFLDNFILDIANYEPSTSLKIPITAPTLIDPVKNKLTLN